jgi:hypothetical protein
MARNLTKIAKTPVTFNPAAGRSFCDPLRQSRTESLRLFGSGPCSTVTRCQMLLRGD